ncbi:hypothetical protein HDU87_000884 [Geranomyces variabilis]|uniref:Uncharacterized protein n=1 Tax=Geranomyces variabilis TaxID=109894 RepID=A0AAD5TCF6_9FUNG|nr:hypothetical protein HDU87_000884 [Geranomyces variabilis]
MILSPRLKENARLPAVLSSIHSKEVDLAHLARDFNVVIIILKAPWCPVCPTLLRVLSFLGLKQPPVCGEAAQWTDPFTATTRKVTAQSRQLNGVLLERDTHFLILCPGPAEALSEIAVKSGWDDLSNASFVADVNWSIIEGLGLRMAAGAWPSTLLLRSDLSVQTIQIGRAPGFYGDRELLAALRAMRSDQETRAITALKQSRMLGRKLNIACLAATRYDHPGRDKLPIELLRAIMEVVAWTELCAVEAGVVATLSPLHAAACACKSWRYVALSTGLDILQAQTDRVDSLLARDPASGSLVTCGGTAWGYPEAVTPPKASVLHLRKETDELMRVEKWLGAIFRHVGDINARPEGDKTLNAAAADFPLCAS